jgi:hypothetical protein
VSSEPGKFWVKVRMKIDIHGKQDSGTDDVGVKKIGGEWFVVSVPS